MKNILKFNESLDIEKDIQLFKDKFKSRMPNGKWDPGGDGTGTSRFARDIDFNRVYNGKGELSPYEIYETDDYGRNVKTIGYVKAISRNHAMLVASIKYNNCEFFLTGFYGSEKVDMSKVNDRILKLENKIKMLKSIFDL